jgi:hypothetical protein
MPWIDTSYLICKPWQHREHSVVHKVYGTRNWNCLLAKCEWQQCQVYTIIYPMSRIYNITPMSSIHNSTSNAVWLVYRFNILPTGIWVHLLSLQPWMRKRKTSWTSPKANHPKKSPRCLRRKDSIASWTSFPLHILHANKLNLLNTQHSPRM